MFYFILKYFVLFMLINAIVFLVSFFSCLLPEIHLCVCVSINLVAYNIAISLIGL